MGEGSLLRGGGWLWACGVEDPSESDSWELATALTPVLRETAQCPLQRLGRVVALSRPQGFTETPWRRWQESLSKLRSHLVSEAAVENEGGLALEAERRRAVQG